MKDPFGCVIRLTRFQELAYVKEAPCRWRFVDMTDNLFRRVGPLYKSRGELLADLHRYAAVFGCKGAT